MVEAILHLNLKGVYWDEIKEKTKKHEFRQVTPFWRKRLEGKHYTKILIKKGYPKKDDTSRILERPWRGYEIQTRTHPIFGADPVEVFAIRVND